MYTNLRIQNFRSYSDYSTELSEGVTIVVGPNASGKTNLLESLYFLSQGKPFRGHEGESIRHNKDWARIDGEHSSGSRTLKLRRNEHKSTPDKELVLDDVTKRRIQAHDTVPVTLFEPEHLRFLVGSPEIRRSYIDTVILMTEPLFKKVHNDYLRAVRQRNQLLKSQPPDLNDQIFVWNVRLSELGEQIVSKRLEVLEFINKHGSEIYSQISGRKSRLEFRYRPSVSGRDYRTALLNSLTGSLTKDVLRGFTAVGPHREDLVVLLNEANAHTDASRGESRSIVLTAKVLEMQRIHNKTDTRPLLLLDDVFSELDGSRRLALTKLLKDHQTLITTTDADAIVKHFLDGYTVIATDQG